MLQCCAESFGGFSLASAGLTKTESVTRLRKRVCNDLAFLSRASFDVWPPCRYLSCLELLVLSVFLSALVCS